mgnify:CR=1 FL=1
MKQLAELLLFLHLFGNGHASVAYATILPPPPPTIIQMVNIEREKVGLNKLTTSLQLTNSAQTKCEDMVAKDYWDHISPDGTTPWYFIESAGYYYRYAGENLCRIGDDTGCMEGWMNSSKHKENILAPEFREMGIGYCKDMIVQHFGAK